MDERFAPGSAIWPHGTRSAPVVIRAWIETVSGYPGLFALCVSSGIALPLPEDFALLYAGARIAGGEWAWGPTLLVAVPGVWLRDLIAWGIGRCFGRWVLEAGWVRRRIGDHRVGRARALVLRHGSFAVLLGRFLIGFRAPIFMVSGAMGVGVRAFAAWDLLGLCVAVPGMVGLGWVFGEPIADLVFWGLQRARLLTGAAVALAAAWAAWRWGLARSAQSPPAAPSGVGAEEIRAFGVDDGRSSG